MQTYNFSLADLMIGGDLDYIVRWLYIRTYVVVDTVGILLWCSPEGSLSIINQQTLEGHNIHKND